jgi:AcrR family transcriptional regulator
VTASTPAAPIVARAVGRPRDPEADRAILEATIELLAEEGFGGLSIEAVAARAGVGKTTVYRRWPSKIPLVVDALTHLKMPASVAIADDMSTRDALVRALSEGIRAHPSQPIDRILAGIIGAMSQDPELADAVRSGLLSKRRESVFALIERGKARGEVRPDADVEVIADLLGGPIVMRRMITGRPVNVRFVRQIVTTVLDGVGLPARSLSSS